MHRGGLTRLDAIVIGGGPAGALTAMHLARTGWRTALIERGERYRTKTCGHCLNPRAFPILQRAGLWRAVQAMTLGATRRLLVAGPNDRMIESSLARDGKCGWIVARREFDQLLRDQASAAGAMVWQSASARAVASGVRGTTVDVLCHAVTTRLFAPLIIGADGVGSAVARRMGFVDGGIPGRKYGFSFDIKAENSQAMPRDAVTMFLVQGGYLGIVRQSDGLAHAAGLVSCDVGDGSRDPMNFVCECAARHPSLGHMGLHRCGRGNILNFAAAGPMPWRPRLVANHTAALVGDAAGYIEPFTGEGMTWALRSAEVLVEVLADCRPGTWNEKLARTYSELWKRQIGSRRRLCGALSFALERRALANCMFRAGALFPAMTRYAVAQVVAA